jgi:hypothetical protein
MIATFFSSPVVWSTSLIELLTLVSLFGLMGGLVKHFQCHAQGCKRFGRYKHGHLVLCRIHHPLVPDDGKITPEHIRSIK